MPFNPPASELFDLIDNIYLEKPMINTVVIDIKTLYGETAKLDNLPDYEGAALEQAGEGNAVILTGAGPVWLYLRLAHAIHGKAISLHYTSPVTGLVEIFNHNPF
jgi:hypothetical protein